MKLSRMNIVNTLLMLLGISLVIFLIRKFFGNKSTPTTTTPIVTAGGSGGGGGGGAIVTNAIRIIAQTLADIYAGTNNVNVVLTAPTVENSCADSNTRRIITIGNGITVKKNGNTVLAVGSTFLATDVISVSINANSFPNTTQQEITVANYVLFSYVAVGLCGDSNVAEIKTNIKVESATQNLQAFTIQDGYILNGNYTPYASLVDAMDKNFEGSGFTNRDATVYVAAMDNYQHAYLDAAKTTKYPQGNYFYFEEFKYVSVDENGILYAFSDIEKPPVTAININDGHN